MDFLHRIRTQWRKMKISRHARGGGGGDEEELQVMRLLDLSPTMVGAGDASSSSSSFPALARPSSSAPLKARRCSCLTCCGYFLSFWLVVALVTLFSPPPLRIPPGPVSPSGTPIVLPPRLPNGRCPIYSYVAPLPGTEIDIGHQMEVWEHAWRASGFEPIFLTPEYAKLHPMYETYRKRVMTYPNFPSDNAKAYEEACYLRWLAFRVVGGGVFMVSDTAATRDFDILYVGSLDFLHRFMALTDCGRAAADSPLSDDNWPMVTIAGPGPVDRIVNYILTAEPDPKLDHTSDMLILADEQGRVELQVKDLFQWAKANLHLEETGNPRIAGPPDYLHFIHFAHSYMITFNDQDWTDGVQMMVRWLQLRYFNTHHILHIDAAPLDLPRSKVFGRFFPLYLPSHTLDFDAMTRERRMLNHPTFLHHWWRRLFGVSPLPSYAREEGELVGWEKCWRTDYFTDGRQRWADAVCRAALPQGNPIDYAVQDHWAWHRRQMVGVRPASIPVVVPSAHLEALDRYVSTSPLFPAAWEGRLQKIPKDEPAYQLQATPGSELVYMISAVDPLVTLAYAYRRKKSVTPSGKLTPREWWQSGRSSAASAAPSASSAKTASATAKKEEAALASESDPRTQVDLLAHLLLQVAASLENVWTLSKNPSRTANPPSVAACTAAIDSLTDSRGPTAPFSSVSGSSSSWASQSPPTATSSSSSSWSLLVLSCFGSGTSVHLALPGPDRQFCRSMCVFERTTGIATGAAGGSYVCGRVAHSPDARFEVCQEVDQTKETFFEMLEEERRQQQKARQEVAGWPELHAEVKKRNERSTRIYRAMVEHVRRQAPIN